MPRRADGQGSSPNSTSETSTRACRSGATCSRSALPISARPRGSCTSNAPTAVRSFCASRTVVSRRPRWSGRSGGAMFQLYVDDLDAVLERLAARALTIYLGPREIWRAVGALEFGQREVFVQDPDGYLVMVAQNIGTRGQAESTI